MLIEMIEKDLMIDAGYLRMLASTASHRYKKYSIPKASGGTRRILHPARELKAIQRWIHERILSEFPVHQAAGAYRRGKGLLAHVSQHKGRRYLLRMDFENFFPSITANDIALHFRKHSDCLPPGWSDGDTKMLLHYVCWHERLTIGAVTSPSLSNTLCYQMDTHLAAQCSALSVVYTRYADDLFFSSNAPNKLAETERIVIETVNSLEYPQNLSINHARTRHSSKKGRMVVTGLVLTPDGRVSIGRERKRKLKAQIHRWPKLEDQEKRSVAGFLAYCMAVEPDFIESLIRKYKPERLNEIREFMRLDKQENELPDNSEDFG